MFINIFVSKNINVEFKLKVFFVYNKDIKSFA